MPVIFVSKNFLINYWIHVVSAVCWSFWLNCQSVIFKKQNKHNAVNEPLKCSNNNTVWALGHGQDSERRLVFSTCSKEVSSCRGRLLQVHVVAAGNARSPTGKAICDGQWVLMSQLTVTAYSRIIYLLHHIHKLKQQCWRNFWWILVIRHWI